MRPGRKRDVGGHSARRLVERVVLVAVIAFLVFCGWWRFSGGSWREVQTPSMGTIAPVGSLLWVQPVGYADLKPGDFITFHPPGRPSETYSHRVYRIDAGGIVTKGVIPGPDPWHLRPADVVGKVVAVWWGVGWVVVAAPVLLIGGLITALARAFARQRWRLPATIVLASLTVTVAITWLRPFVNAEQLAFRQVGVGAEATYVGTGLLPVRLTSSAPGDAARPGGSVVMHDGEVGTVQVSKADPRGRLQVRLGSAIPFWWWALLVALCFLPALWSLLVGLPSAAVSSSEDGDGST